MSAYEILKDHGVTRLCHFTKFQNLTHIITSEDGILASGAIRQDTKHVNDTARYDGELNCVCCSVQYPNSWFLNTAIQKNTDKIFDDWIVMYINLDVLNYRNAKFCPCNASKSKGAYINSNIENIASIFEPVVSGFSRTSEMLSCCPTNGQAEILIENDIPRKYIDGIAVGNENIAARVYAMLKIYEMEYINLYIAPDVLTTNWSPMIKRGCLPQEVLYDRLGEG